MLIRKLKDCVEITAGDSTRLRELLHPKRDHAFSGRYSLAHAVIDVGHRSFRHKLKTSEVYYVISGEGKMHIDEETTVVQTGDAIVIPPDSIQWVENIGPDPFEFLCVVDPAWDSSDEEVME